MQEGGHLQDFFYSEGDMNRRGIGLIVAEEVLRSVMMVEPNLRKNNSNEIKDEANKCIDSADICTL